MNWDSSLSWTRTQTQMIFFFHYIFEFFFFSFFFIIFLKKTELFFNEPKAFWETKHKNTTQTRRPKTSNNHRDPILLSSLSIFFHLKLSLLSWLKFLSWRPNPSLTALISNPSSLSSFLVNLSHDWKPMDYHFL